MTPEWFVDETLAWAEGEAEAGESRKSSGVKPGEEDIRVQARNAGLLMPPGDDARGPKRDRAARLSASGDDD